MSSPRCPIRGRLALLLAWDNNGQNSAAAAKVNGYLQSFGIVVVNAALISVLGKIFGIFGATAVEWTFQFIIYNVVLLLMGWLHWSVDAITTRIRRGRGA